jgi:hypothetical protein
MTKHKTKHKPKAKPVPRHRNAAPAVAAAAPRPYRPRPRAATKPAEPEDTNLRRLLYTAGGAAGTALVGTFLAREGWAPKTIAGLLTAAGGVAAWTSEDPTIKNVGAGAMSAAGSQLALLMFDGRDEKDAPAKPRQADLNELPPGALDAAFERARSQLSVAADDARRYSDAA